MDPSPADRRTAAAHAALAWANPLDASAQARLLDGLAARLPARPLRAADIGCGPGAWSEQLARRAPQLHLTGIDRNPLFIARAEQAATGAVRFVCGDARLLDAQPPFDVLLCIGASQAFGTPRQALAHLASRLAPGGHLLWADLEWAAAPAPEFLDFLGCPLDWTWSSQEAQAVFAAAGFRVLQREGASAAAWQTYEDAVLAGRLALADREHDAPARAQALTWRARFEAQGRHCLGFTATLLCNA